MNPHMTAEKLLRTLVLSGTYSALSLVGTKADDIDTNIAPQLGLSDDCSIQELVAAYCAQTVTEARKQLEQMVRDLPTSLEEEETLARMIEMARQVPVHTTSANAYIVLLNHFCRWPIPTELRRSKRQCVEKGGETAFHLGERFV